LPPRAAPNWYRVTGENEWRELTPVTVPTRYVWSTGDGAPDGLSTLLIDHLSTT